MWNTLVHPRVDLSEELYRLEQCVPDSAKQEIERCDDLDSVWSFLDREYGSTIQARLPERRMTC